MIIGWIGLFILLLAYLFLLLDKNFLFLIINIIALFVFVIHYYLIKDYPVLFVNLFIIFMLGYKLKRGIKK